MTTLTQRAVAAHAAQWERQRIARQEADARFLQQLRDQTKGLVERVGIAWPAVCGEERTGSGLATDFTVDGLAFNVLAQDRVTRAFLIRQCPECKAPVKDEIGCYDESTFLLGLGRVLAVQLTAESAHRHGRCPSLPATEPAVGLAEPLPYRTAAERLVEALTDFIGELGPG